MRISTNGYRGPLTDNAYMPPGEYDVVGKPNLNSAARQCSHELANYLLEIDLAVEVIHETPGDDEVDEVVSDDPIWRTPEKFAADMELTGDDIDGMLKADLISLAEKLDLDASGNKSDLQDRLKKYFS